MTKVYYYILAGTKGFKKAYLDQLHDLNLSKEFFMIIDRNSKLGKLIKKEVNKQCKNNS